MSMLVAITGPFTPAIFMISRVMQLDYSTAVCFACKRCIEVGLRLKCIGRTIVS